MNDPRWETSRITVSLTTPPCSESVKWYFRRTPTELSKAQIAAFTAVYDHNNGPYRRWASALCTSTRTRL